MIKWTLASKVHQQSAGATNIHLTEECLLLHGQVGAVVCGVDPGLSYYKIQYASLCLLQNLGCLFIATNTDSRGHFTPNQEWAGAGATVGAIKGTEQDVSKCLRATRCGHKSSAICVIV